MKAYLLFATNIYGIYRDAPTRRGKRYCHGVFSSREKAETFAKDNELIDGPSMDVEIVETTVDPDEFFEI